MITNPGIYTRGGVITQSDADYCTVRIRMPAGCITAEQMRGIARIAEEHGCGDVHLTTRQTMEIPHVDPVSLKALEAALEKNGTPVGAEREEVVNIVACPGTDRCKFANIETIGLARELDRRLFGKELPVKVRIGISACPNACSGELLNEIGITGIRKPIREPGICNGCGTCVSYCKEDAILIKDGISELDEHKCISCGVCVLSCPFNLLKASDPYYRITVGGRRGRHPHVGQELVTVRGEEAVIKVIERIVNQIYRRGWSGRLLADQLDDIGFDELGDKLISELLEENVVVS